MSAGGVAKPDHWAKDCTVIKPGDWDGEQGIAHRPADTVSLSRLFRDRN